MWPGAAAEGTGGREGGQDDQRRMSSGWGQSGIAATICSPVSGSVRTRTPSAS